ncbi:phosphonoacetaldehyde hydrolase [Neokomagataea thailandica NBRC 106555]|nr:phosphonoacetaldehyde hydrolase [Neokomagataea thailandica NBRC 106555]
MQAFTESFARHGVPISIAEARTPMGMAKRPHIAALLAQPRIMAAWKNTHGRFPSEDDLSHLYEDFMPRNIRSAALYADPIPGAAECLKTLRDHGLKIGSTTGYTRSIMEHITPIATAHGVFTDHLVCADETPAGRPSPLMLWQNLINLNVWSAQRVIKVDDTPVGILEGLNAGAWAVGVAVSGNMFGHTPSEIAAMPAELYQTKRTAAYAALHEAGAHYVIDTIADLPDLLRRHAQQEATA